MSTELLKRRDKRGPVAWMAGHGVAANLVMLTCLVGGGLALRNIKQEVFPDIAADAVEIVVEYPGASPEEVEKGIVLSVEEAVRSLEGVDEVNATAREGAGAVVVELLPGVDVQRVAQDVQSEVDRITTFPDDAEEPQVRVVQHRRQVLSVALHGHVSDSVLHEIGEKARDFLQQDPNISQVELEGIPPLEIGIEISQENLRRYGLTLEEAAARLRAASIEMPGGGLKTAGGEVLVRVRERRDYGRQFARLPLITTADGSEVLLGQVATIDDGFEDTDRYARYNGENALMLEVYRVGDQTPMQVSNAVRAQLEDLRPTLPPGISADIEGDRSDIYRQRVELLVKNGALGLVLVLILLGLFLEARLAFWVMMGIPISFLGSFLFLPAAGVTVNMMSLFAYIIALGIVVDDAIVVGENVYFYRQQGMGPLAAAIRGAREVAMPVTFSILTNIVAFLPIAFIPGEIGKIFRMIPIVVTVVFVISLVESLFVLPAHLANTRQRRGNRILLWLHDRQQAFSHAFIRWVHRRYGPFLDFCLRHRYLTISVALSLLAAALSYAYSGRLGFALFPVVESDYSQASVTMPYGAPVQRTEAVMQRLLAGARQVLAETGHPELVEAITYDVGISGGHTGRMRVELADAEIRDPIMGTEAFTRRWREVVGEVPGVESLKFAADAGGPGSGGRPLSVELSHRDLGVLEAASRDLADIVATYPLASDVDDGFQPGKPQLDFTVKPEGKSLGLTAAGVARQVRSAFYGAEVLRQQRGRNELRVRVRLPEADRSTEQTIADLMVSTPAGVYVPLREAATMERGRAYTTITRRNGRRVVQVSADITPRSKAGEVIGDLQANVLPDLMRTYPGLRCSFEGHQADIRESFGSLKFTFVLALLAIYVMLAIPFRSYTQPLIIMISIPFGVVGAVLGHMIMGYDLCIPSIFGIVALSGVVVNDSLVMIDFANRHRADYGSTCAQAIHAAGVQRFRPIMLTTLTTFGGLAPMIFETSRQARFLIPMALSLGYGILFATFITLVIVPALYIAIEDAQRGALAARRFLAPRPAPPAAARKPEIEA
jgi:multidrug efflux pump subunit AcrB